MSVHLSQCFILLKSNIIQWNILIKFKIIIVTVTDLLIQFCTNRFRGHFTTTYLFSKVLVGINTFFREGILALKKFHLMEHSNLRLDTRHRILKEIMYLSHKSVKHENNQLVIGQTCFICKMFNETLPGYKLMIHRWSVNRNK